MLRKRTKQFVQSTSGISSSTKRLSSIGTFSLLGAVFSERTSVFSVFVSLLS